LGNTYEFIIFLVHLIISVPGLILSCMVEPPASAAEIALDRPRLGTRRFFVCNPLTLALLSYRAFMTCFSPELSANLFSLISFQWINPMMVTGYKRTLTEAGVHDISFDS
jgi:hypothetical protein